MPSLEYNQYSYLLGRKNSTGSLLIKTLHLTDNTFIHISKFEFLPKLLLVFLLCDTWALHIPGKQKVGRENAAKDYIQILVIILLYIPLSPKYMETKYGLCNTN